MKITKDRDGIRHCVRVFATMLCAATDNPRLRAAIRNAISGCDIEAEIPGVVECTSLEVWSQNLLLTHFINSVDSTDLRLEALLCAATCLAFKYAGIFLAQSMLSSFAFRDDVVQDTLQRLCHSFQGQFVFSSAPQCRAYVKQCTRWSFRNICNQEYRVPIGTLTALVKRSHYSQEQDNAYFAELVNHSIRTHKALFQVSTELQCRIWRYRYLYKFSNGAIALREFPEANQVQARQTICRSLSAMRTEYCRLFAQSASVELLDSMLDRWHNHPKELIISRDLAGGILKTSGRISPDTRTHRGNRG
jgi:hypothetical protein